jgi:hypothetical protein
MDSIALCESATGCEVSMSMRRAKSAGFSLSSSTRSARAGGVIASSRTHFSSQATEDPLLATQLIPDGQRQGGRSS